MPRRSILVAVAQPTFRLGTSVALEDGGFVVVGHAATAAEAVTRVIVRRPDMCVLDCSIAGGALYAVRTISTHMPQTAVLMVTDAVEETELMGALRAGASGYLPKSADPARLRAAVHAVLAGDTAIPRPLVLSLIEELGDAPARRHTAWLSPRGVRLTGRESQVVGLLENGSHTRDIAAELGISVVTVRRHISEALRKLGAADRRAAITLLGEKRDAG